MNSNVQTTPDGFDALTLAEFVSKVEAILGVGADLNPYSSLVAEVGADSLQLFELLVASERLAGCVEPPLELPRLDTLVDAYDHYLRCRSCR